MKIVVSDTVNALQDDPIYTMSLSSNELFHSNFWKWLFKRNIAYVNIFFPKLDGELEVYREQDYTDIKLCQGKKTYIIENKFKSIPCQEQLERYQKNEKQFVSGVITGILEPTFSLPDWRFLSYQELSDQILKTAQRVEVRDSFEQILIIRYAQMFHVLSAQITEAVKAVEGYWEFGVDLSQLDKIKLADITKKLMSNQALKYIEPRVREVFPNGVGDYVLYFHTDFTHKQALVDVKFEQRGDPNRPQMIGVQIQGIDYRCVVETHKDMSAQAKEDLYKKYVELGWFEDNVLQTKQFRGHFSPQRVKYRIFGDNMRCQYWRISEAESDLETLTKHIIEDLKFAETLIREKTNEKRVL